MEDPVREIPTVIWLLTQSPPALQQLTIDKYFTPNAQFTHPFCRTGTGSHTRYLISRIYRWYKIMSPKIAADITSISYDEKNMVLFVGITQVFAIWLIPTHKSKVSLVTVLHLTNEHPDTIDKTPKDGNAKYYITSQNDLYQTDQFVKFVLPWFHMIVPLWQLLATFVCVVLSYLFYPVTWIEDNWQKDFARLEQPPKWNDAR